MLVLAGGAEEQHLNTATLLLGAWAGVLDTSIDGTTKYTGAASYIFKGGAAGSSPMSSQTAKGWWSYAAYLPQWGNGTYRVMWTLGSDGGGTVLLGWAVGASNDEHQIRLVTRTGTYDSTAEFTYAQWHRVKVEFDNGVWTIWASDNGGAFAEVLSRDDSATYTALTGMSMNVGLDSDETKAANQWYRGDDCLFWDPTGDNWNSRIGAQDFPQISAAHMPDTTGAKTESDAGQAALLDEIPPTAVAEEGDGINCTTFVGTPDNLIDTDEAWADDAWNGYYSFCHFQKMDIVDTINATQKLEGGDWSADPGDGYPWWILNDTADNDYSTYWANVENLKDVANGGSIPNDAVIQAVMVTRVDFATAWSGELNKFNLYDGTDIYADSEEGGKIIQRGSSSADYWYVAAGYYPWTPTTGSEANWTQLLFEACGYGCSLVKWETNQLTVQVIYFGTVHKWEPPVAPTGRRWPGGVF